jgi:hypothetical protein
MYDKVSTVYLSSANISYSYPFSAVDTFTRIRRVSAFCPPFSGYAYPQTYYTVNSKNHITVNLTSLTGVSGFIDIILYGRAGYTKLSDKGYLVYNTNTFIPPPSPPVPPPPVTGNNIGFRGEDLLFFGQNITYNIH